jgi:hypothetical protein
LGTHEAIQPIFEVLIVIVPQAAFTGLVTLRRATLKKGKYVCEDLLEKTPGEFCVTRAP